MTRSRTMRLFRFLFGRPLATSEQESEQLGVASGVAVLGLDALASAAYGPEAALTVFALAGASGLTHVIPITLLIVGILLVVGFSYRQTISTHPDGGGSYTVAKENLGLLPGLLAASALFLDYLLNVAVAISAGVGALVSMVPRLLPLTLPLCLVVLAFLTLVNLRGIRATGAVFLAPTYAFVGTLGISIALGLWNLAHAHGTPVPVVAPPSAQRLTGTVGIWLLVRSFASGCTAMTGVEAVSNAVPIFREPRVRRAERTLGTIVLVLVMLLIGLALLARAYHVAATEPGRPGYQSIISQLVGAVAGRGAFYGFTMVSVVTVLCLSANTSFADFPRLCRMLALDDFLPEAFAHQGRRLVYSVGIVLLSTLAGLLLIAFGGITDRLIPLFAIGALSAFTLSQAGMVAYWHRRGAAHRRSRTINFVGAVVTGITLVVVAASKFTEGAWVSLVIIGATLGLFLRMRRHYMRVRQQTAAEGPLALANAEAPVVVVPLRRLDRITRKALRFALSISHEVFAVQVRGASMSVDDLSGSWGELVEKPVRAHGLRPPRLVVLRSEYREVSDPLLRFVRHLAKEHPGRRIAVIVPEVVERRWYHYLLHSHTATTLRLMLFFRGGPQVVLISAPWYLSDRPQAERGWRPEWETMPRVPRPPPSAAPSESTPDLR